MDPKRKAVYDTLSIFAQKFENLDLIDGSIVHSQAWKKLLKHIVNDKERREAYIERYLSLLRPLIEMSLESNDPLEMAMDGILTDALCHLASASDETTLLSAIKRVLASPCLPYLRPSSFHSGPSGPSISYTSVVDTMDTYNAHLDCISVTRSVDEDKNIILKIGGLTTKDDNVIDRNDNKTERAKEKQMIVKLSMGSHRIIRRNPVGTILYLRQFLALGFLFFENQIKVYLEMACQDLKSSLGEVVASHFFPKSIFETFDPYLETAVCAGLIITDDDVIDQFKADFSSEFPLVQF